MIDLTSTHHILATMKTELAAYIKHYGHDATSASAALRIRKWQRVLKQMQT
jgi:hypothetical protein